MRFRTRSEHVETGVEVTFRPAHLGDVEAIARLHTDSWKRHYRGMMRDAFLDGEALANRLQVWRERLGRPPANQFACVAEVERELAGFVCAFGNEDPVWGSYVDNLHVELERKRRGIGSKLLARTGTWLAERFPDCGVYLWVMEANHAARRFYEALGATNAGTTIKQDPGGGAAPNCRYVWAGPAALASRGPR
jgi:GNAT superfamily N-acetyltransferase